MSPHRPLSVAVYAWESIARIPTIMMDPAIAGAGALMGVVSLMVGVSNVRLFYLVCLAMVLNLLVGGLGAVISRTFNAARLYGGILGKLFRLLLVPVASLADQFLSLMPIGDQLPTGTYPLCAFVLWCLGVAELVSSLQKFEEAGILPRAIAQIIDRLRAAQPSLPIAPRDPGATPKGGGASDA